MCPMHKPKVGDENQLMNVAVFRRVYINRDENRQIASMMQQGYMHYCLRVGSLVFQNVGQVLPHQLAAFHTVGFKATRFYWSKRQVHKRARYVCTITEQAGKPQFNISVIEKNHAEVKLSGSSAAGECGLGLYAAREIEKHTMCIEYIGELIRNEVAENRERIYETQVRMLGGATIAQSSGRAPGGQHVVLCVLREGSTWC
ncbi:PREDICTED: histone-lysine N-methyltransferase trr-like, partial [Priapulus caudatus]|uniref:Histone-lysine N-methyltransferase trr-like n=1 Tax=Priapulus caudatus TaxID=37621 RepID=A0ABM1F6K4_PRICU